LFYVNARKNLFYCHGCGYGGDLIRFVELSLGLSSRESVAYLQQSIPPADHGSALEGAAAFYQLQLHRHAEAVQYFVCWVVCRKRRQLISFMQDNEFYRVWMG
jgi:DNA primase